MPKASPTPKNRAARGAPVAVPPSSPGSIWWWAGALVLLVALTYSRTPECGFIWDDDFHVENNETLRSTHGLWRIWTERGAVPQYYPLTHTSFWLEYQLWGLRPAGYHVVNLALHALTAVLVWRLLARLQVPGAWLAAALFAVHPVEVESVAWITERKNVLSLVFALGSLLAYLRFAPAAETPVNTASFDDLAKRWPWYAAAWLLYAAALFCKTVTATLPAVLLVIYWWKRGRLAGRDVALLLPFFGVGLALASVTVGMEKHSVGASGEVWNLDTAQRVIVAGRAAWFYASKLLAPVQLNFFYPRWAIESPAWWQFLFPLAACGALVALWLLRTRVGRGPLAAALIFVGVLTPALGFFDVYPFRFSFVADHFQYHASIALLSLVAAAATVGWQWVQPRGAPLGWCVTAGLIGLLAVVSWQRTVVYQDSTTLFTDVVDRDPNSWIGHNNLGTQFLAAGDVPKAIRELQTASQIQPQYIETHNALAIALADQGNMQAALAWLERALQEPDAAPSHIALTYNNLAWLLATTQDEARRDPPRAVAMANEALRLAPDMGAYFSTLGVAEYRAGNWAGAIAALERSIALRPQGGDSGDRFFLAMANYRLGRRDLADKWYNDARARLAGEPANRETQRFAAEAQTVLGTAPAS